ncbi:MAG: glycosyltransferase family 2 protein [Patescibacteria group bacterium]|jgi:hypothetical protein
MNGGKVSIIIVSYNGKKFLDKLFFSIRNQSYVNYEVICVDNASRDGSVEYLRHNFPEVQVIEWQNFGYGRACNHGVQSATGEYVMFLNEDMHIPVDFVENLVATYERTKQSDPQIGVLACNEDHYDTTKRYNVFPGKIDWFGYTAANFAKSRKGAFVPGCPFFITRRLFLEAGGFCPNIFLYGDDIDLSWRLIIMGKNNYTEPEICLYHYAGASMEGFPPKKIYYLMYGSTIGVFNNYSLGWLLIFLPLNLLFNLLVINFGLLIFARFNLKYNYQAFKATTDFLVRIPRLLPFRRQAQKLRRVGDWQFIKQHMIWQSSFFINQSHKRLVSYVKKHD